MSVIKTGTTSTTGYIVESDTNGNLVIQTGSTPTTALTLNSDQTATFAQSVNIPNTFGFKNRIINGGMVIDQRNAGASINLSATGQFPIDRFYAWEDTDGTATAQRSTIAPTGFTNSLLFTVGTADTSLAATQYAAIAQWIEGFNVADLGWGTASAATVTLSFWVRSSVTGTFGGAFRNNANNRSYPYTYTISSANTWEYKTVTVPGDTTGTWTTDNSAGIKISWGLGAGSTYSGTAGAWAGSFLISATGATNLMATAGATFYITGVQLERGSTATSFDFRPYGTELMLCQRYCFVIPGSGSINELWGLFLTGFTTTRGFSVLSLPVPLRAGPTITQSGSFPANLALSSVGSVSGIAAFQTFGNIISLDVTCTGLTANSPFLLALRSTTLSAEL